MTRRNVDPVTERVVANAFRSICEEMGHTMIRTANSTIFVQGRDFSCAIVDSHAELVAAANFDPSHLSAMALTVEFAILHFGRENIKPGDVYLINDPYRGGGHLPDISLIRPIFCEDALLAFAVNRAHHLDVGGVAVGSLSGQAHSIFQEGLRIPPVRWFMAGEENTDVIDMVTLNMRFSKDQLGDFRAQLASTSTAQQRLLRLAQKYGAAMVRACMEESKNHSEKLMRAIINELPDGTYEFDEFIEDDGVTDQPYRIHVAVTVGGDSVLVDFAGTSPQASGPVNSSFGNTLSSTFNAMLQLTGPDVAFNHGCFRPVKVNVPRGCLLNPLPPAPCFGGVTEVSIRVIDAILGALSGVAPERVGAGSYGTCICFSGGGFDSIRGADFGFFFFLEGGWGACAWRDGWNCTPNPTSNFTDYPVEWVESTLPIVYKEVRLNTDSGGPGRRRGGLGVVRTVRLLADDVELNALGERMKVPPFGIDGGHPGGCNNLLVKRANTTEWKTIAEAFGVVSPSKFHGAKVGENDELRIITGGGGGCGDPLARPPEEVVADVAEAYVSRETASDVYGVTIVERKDGSLDFNPQETEASRERLKRTQAPAVREYDRIVADVLARAAAGEPDSRTRFELERVNDLIGKARIHIGRTSVTDSDMPRGRSLKNPFLNDRALQYWDADSLERWMARHGFAVGEH